MSLKKCIGIASYLPEENELLIREKRSERLTNLFLQLEELWPEIDILIIAQNWQDYQPPKISNKIIIDKYDKPLTIVGARNTLRNKFLELDYDYIIMLDDDAHIFVESPEIAAAYMQAIDNNPDKFCFIHDPFNKHWHTMDDYIPAPLNLCAISRFIYAKEEIPSAVLEKNEALEDDIFAVLLHVKYVELEFLPPKGIYCDHYKNGQYAMAFKNPGKIWPSTWYTLESSNLVTIVLNTMTVLNYIVRNKELPDLEKLKENSRWIC